MTNKEALNPWIAHSRPVPAMRLRLFCFPYAGGSAAVFRKWKDFLSPKVEVCPIQLPGRGTRQQEPPFTDMNALVRALGSALSGWLDTEFAFFGHSMGATIGYELAHHLREEHGLEPIHLFVSGRRAPQIPDSGEHTYDLPEPQFVEELRRLNGTPGEVLANPELLGLILPSLRSDFELIQTYRYVPRRALSCAITAMGGLEDKDVDTKHIQAWQVHSSGPFSVRMFRGDHFFLQGMEAAVVNTVAGELERFL